MDPLSHAAFGFTLGGLARSPRLGRSAPALAALGALLPDIDAVVMPTGWDRYLVVHEIGTHSLCGALVCALGAAWLIRLSKSQFPLSTVFLALSLGALSHVALDVLSGATIRLLWPLADRRFSEALVAMADPWLAGVLIGCVVAQHLVRREHRTRVARVGILVVTMMLIAKAVLLGRALQLYHAEVGRDGVRAYLPAVEWGSLTTWHVRDRTGDEVRNWQVDARAATTRLLLRVATDQDAPNAESAKALGTVRNFLRAHDFVFALTWVGPDSTQVLTSDVRYCWNPLSPGAASPAPGTPYRPTLAPVACDLWVGGSLDTAGAPAGQVVWLGTWVQRRR